MLAFKAKSASEEDVIEAMKAMADKYGMWTDVKYFYEHNRESGMEPMQAAYDALYEWDLLDYEPDTKTTAE